MTYVQKARLTFLGIDDELKNDTSSFYTTNLNSSLFPAPVTLTVANATEYDNQNMGLYMMFPIILLYQLIQKDLNFH
jgi:hypothetical protein